MTLAEHMGQSLFVAFRFLIGDASYLKYVEPTGQGVLRSFSALMFAAPVYFLIHWLQFRGPTFDLMSLFYILGMFVTYAIAWVLFAYIFYYVWPTIGPAQNYLAYMQVYNWGRVFFLLIMVPFFALESFAIIEGSAVLIVWWISLALGLSYKYYITLKALKSPAFPAILFVLFDVLLVLFVEILFIQAISYPGSLPA